MEKLLDCFVPKSYILDLAVDKFAKTIGGTVTVKGEVLNETVKFHAVDLEIKSVLVNEKKVKFKADGKVLEISRVELGEAEIVIKYNGKLNENMEGAYLSTYKYNGETEIIVATQFESHYAREAFPCIDEPAAKATFELMIALPEESDDLVLSNMPIDVVRDNTIVFVPTPRMSTYLLAFVIGKFHEKTVKNAHGVEITTYCALNQDVDSVDFANEVAAKSLEFYDDNFGIVYPLPKLDQVALPDFEAGAMENWGLVTYRESMLLASKDATLGTRKSVALTVAHELSHQWFGNLVTMQWWDDLWLNESFATAMEYYAVDAIYPEYKIFESFFTGNACAALLRDAYKDVQSVHQEVHDPEEIATLFDGAIVYAKGARLMVMLIRLMGWEEFCKGIRDYFEKHKYNNTVGNDLWKALEPYAEFNPNELMHAFIDKPGYPVVTNQKGDFEEFSQQRFLLDGPCIDEDWPLPGISEDMSGHYVLNLTEDEFEARLSNFDKLGLEERLRLLIDRDLITKAGMQNPVSLIPLAKRFISDDSGAIWSKIAALVGNLKVYVDDESDEEKLLKKFTKDLVDSKLAEVGLMTCKGDDENVIKLRANLLALDYYAEDVGRLHELADKYDEDYTKMDAEIREDILSAKVYLEPKFASECVEKYQKINDPDVKFDYLAAATLVRDETELKKLFKLLGENEIVKPQDQSYLFVWLYRNPKVRLQVFDWLVQNWDLVKRMGGDKTLDTYPIVIAHLARTQVEYDKYRAFFEPMLSNPSLKRAVKIGLNEIKARLELIKKYQDDVIKALA